MEDLRISMIQSRLHWEDVGANLEAFTSRVLSINEPTDIILLPEMFNTGFSMNVKTTAEEPNGKTFDWMAQMAKEKDSIIVGSMVIRENDTCYNRLVWMRQDGSFETYDKRHLFRMGQENDFFSQGEHRLIVEHKGWRICPLICYDLRFPVWSRNQFFDQQSSLGSAYDVLIYVANWPKVRRNAWSQLLLARAIENQCYTIGLNRIGDDGNGVAHSGDSAFISPKGEYLAQAMPEEEEIITQSLSWSDLENFREKFPVSLDADRFSIG